MIKYQLSITWRYGRNKGTIKAQPVMKQKIISKELQSIPGVGPAIARDLHDLGYTSVPGLQGQDPEAIYARLCDLRGGHIDRCVLYVFRCAVYFAGPGTHEPELLKWWNWKDRKEK